jgi:hypothetical protein
MDDTTTLGQGVDSPVFALPDGWTRRALSKDKRAHSTEGPGRTSGWTATPANLP